MKRAKYRAIGLDFETYSGTDLLTRGLANYVECDTFRPLLASLCERDEQSLLDITTYDLVNEDYEEVKEKLFARLDGAMIVAHNAGFEQAVLRRMGLDLPSDRFIDSAVLARAAGVAGKLEAAAPQLLNVDKLESGAGLIKLFSIPGRYQTTDLMFNPEVKFDHPGEWTLFIEYCEMDARLSLALYEFARWLVGDDEMKYQAITMDMNNVGWPVDLSLTQEMYERYLNNLEEIEFNFRSECNEPNLNLNSTPQMKAWCEVRGVRADSFDEASVQRLSKAVNRRLSMKNLDPDKERNYEEVAALLRTKQELGGSSLKKLKVILDTVGPDGRLHDQYLHIGAGATYRTTGRGVQMQNLPRLHGSEDVEMMENENWSNTMMSHNLRKVFAASTVSGELIVGDFSSVESRGLAWQAGEFWKLNAYDQGRDLYKALASKFYHVDEEDVTKEQRQFGKVGELACGYGAGPGAVQSFAEGMGVIMQQAEATKLVNDWRRINPFTVAYWHMLDSALREALEENKPVEHTLKYMTVKFTPVTTPQSLFEIHNGTMSMMIQVRESTSAWYLMSRIIHGVHVNGNSISYYKPSERKTGPLWSKTYTDQKTKEVGTYSLYGGKLAGLLTQSLCREVFFSTLLKVSEDVKKMPNVKLIGQFHDEIVLEWEPGAVSLDAAKDMLKGHMSDSPLMGFPLAADVKHAHRYIK